MVERDNEQEVIENTLDNQSDLAILKKETINGEHTRVSGRQSKKSAAIFPRLALAFIACLMPITDTSHFSQTLAIFI